MTRERATGPAYGWLFLALVAIYLLTYTGRFHVIDEVSIYALAENLAKRGALDTDQILWSQWARPPREVQGDFGRGGHVYSQKGWPTALLPATLVALALPVDRWGLVFAAFFANIPLTALTAVGLAAFLHQLGFTARTATWTALIYGVGTLAWPYSRLLFGEPVATLGLVGALYAAHRGRETNSVRWLLLSALLFAFAVWARAVNLLLWPFFVLYLGATHTSPRPWRRTLFWAGSALVLGGGGYALYNVVRFGAPWYTGYQVSLREAFSTPVWLGAYGLLLSPFRGLAWFSPIVWAVLMGARPFYRRDPHSARVFAGMFATYTLFYSTWWSWSGEFAWGPRFLLPVLPVLMPFVAAAWETAHRRRWVLILAVVSTAVQVLAVTADFTLGETVLEMQFGEPREAWSVLLSPRWSPLVLQAIHLRQGFWDIAWVRVGRDAWPIVLGSGLALAAATWAVRQRRTMFCRGGYLLAALLLGLTGILGLDRYSAWAQRQPFEQAVHTALQRVRAEGTAEDVLITIAPFDYPSIMNWAHGRWYTLGFAPHPPPLRPEEARLLTQTTTQATGRLWVLVARMPPAHPELLAERWLSQRAFLLSHQWVGDLRLLSFAPPAAPNTGIRFPLNAVNPQAPGPLAVRVVDWPGQTGRWLRVEVRWQSPAQPTVDYTAFVHLLTPDDRYISGIDAPPVNGYLPTTRWSPGQEVVDRKALMVPADLPPGEYFLEVGMYDPASGERVPLLVDGQEANRVLIGPIPIVQTTD